MPEKQIQEYLFQRIKESLLPGNSLVDVVAEKLHLSQDSAYRRIRGETLLVLEEARTLCDAYNISLDELLQLRGNSVVFQTASMDEEGMDFKSYLKGILKQINKLNTFNQKSIIYITNDIPLFHQFYSRPVLAFRSFFWMKTIFHHPDFSRLKFSMDCLPAGVEQLAKEISSVYSQIPSIEIWNAESVNSVLSQVNYYCEAGIMSREDALQVYAGLRTSLEHLQLQAEYGRKFLPGENHHTKKDNFQLFVNRVGLGDNTILTLHDGGKTVYLNYDALSYMATTDESFCNNVYGHLQTIMRRSTLISSVSEKQRNIFFNILYSKLHGQQINQEKLAT